jgi:dTDP-4-dehydrorhamnose reductase
LGRPTSDAFAEAGWRVVAPARSTLDIVDRDAVRQAVTGLRPEVVVNTAAWTAVDACEADHDRAFAANALGPRHVAEACRLVGAHLVHVSTDYVFDGSTDRAYTEWDEARPTSVYGRSKLAGEREAGPDATIVRTAWLSGACGNNVVRTVLAMAGEADRPLRFVDDQCGSPTVAEELAAMLLRLASERRTGLFHVTNQGSASWYDLARHVLAVGGHDPGRVSAIPTAELRPQRPAPRPRNAVLDNAVLRLAGLPLLSPWQDAVADLVRRLQSGPTI